MKKIVDGILASLPTRSSTLLLGILLLYLASSIIHLNPNPTELEGLPSLMLGPISVAPPRALSGDSVHYLVSINSLIEDGDFDLSNNYQQALEGDWDAGARLRKIPLQHHAELDRLGRERSTHSPFFALLVAAVCWPLRETRWVETAAVLSTLLVSWMGLLLFLKSNLSNLAGPQTRVLMLALASPLWCYARNLWTEPWVMTCWILLLLARRPWILFLAGFLGTLIKYPFMLVPLTLSGVEFYQALGARQVTRKVHTERGIILLASAVAGLLCILGVTQFLFRESDHFSWFHSGVHASFGIPTWSLVGLWFDPSDGLFWFFPLFILGWLNWRQWEPRYWVPLLAFFLLHASYQDWGGGTGFSARYLVPALPVLVCMIPLDQKSRGLVPMALWSLFWGALGGILPALVFDRTPWGVFQHILAKLNQ